MQTRRFLTLVVLVALCSSLLVAGQSPEGTSFVNRFARALSSRDRDAIAEMVRYPLPAVVGGIVISIGSRGDLLNVYDSIFTAELRCAVEEGASRGAGAIRADGRGMTFGNSGVRIEDVGGMMKITRIAVPPATGNAPPAVSEPKRVTRRNQQFTGRLYGDGVDSYIIRGQRGDVVQARIEQFPGRSAAVRVVEMKTGKTLERPGASAPRVWNGTLQETGDYRVDVVRLAPYCMPPFTYLLTVTVK